MKYIDLIQRLQHNPDEAVIVYHGIASPGAAWIVDRQGVVQHLRAVDGPLVDAMSARAVRHVASVWPSRAMIFRPTSDFTEAASA